jgi:hypothetical protein
MDELQELRSTLMRVISGAQATDTHRKGDDAT